MYYHSIYGKLWYILGMDEIKKKRWYQRNWFIIFLQVIFFPIGIPLMWVASDWEMRSKVLVTGLFVFLIAYGFYNNDLENNTQHTASQVKEITQVEKDSLAKTFCDERSKPNRTAVNFSDYIKMVEKTPETITLNPARGKYPTPDNCKKITSICLNLWSLDECTNIAERKIWIGMTENQLILSWGLPDKRNNTTNSWGISTQWVYGDSLYGADYAYLEGQDKGSMKVKSWQSSN